MIQIAFRQVRVSDLSGQELDDAEVVTVNVIDEGKLFDAHPDELKVLKPLKDVLKLQLRYASGQVADVLVSRADFQKLVPDDKLAGFSSNRGRRPGFSPAARNGA